MDEKDRTCSKPGQIPAHLRFAVDGWLEDVSRNADAPGASPQIIDDGAVDVVGLRDALAAGTLTAAQTAELAGGAVRWLHHERAEVAAEDAGRRARAAGELVALGDRAVARASRPGHGPRVVTVDAETRDVLREQTLMVLEFGHHPFEEVRDLRPPELLAVAAVFRDAFAVLDTIGWLATPHTGPVCVTITPGHFAQLKQRRGDIALSLLHRLDNRDELTEPGDIAEADAAILADRQTAHALLHIMQAYQTAT
jgi:hypothetical protein